MLKATLIAVATAAKTSACLCVLHWLFLALFARPGNLRSSHAVCARTSEEWAIRRALIGLIIVALSQPLQPKGRSGNEQNSALLFIAGRVPPPLPHVRAAPRKGPDR